ncbi:unnamed protein product [Amoebophrya sp. A120]|nr:unnamed protein product [Amoebophrya sp. A120]|eukprot:GSA120T00018002001.1
MFNSPLLKDEDCIYQPQDVMTVLKTDPQTITLSNGCVMPKLGLGTWKSKVGEVEAAVKAAIDCGYRHIDCAFAYGNEHEVGKAIAAKIADGTVRREELWVTGKLWNTFHRKEFVEEALKCSLRDLQLDYIDLFLIHWPVDFACKWTPGEPVIFDAGKAFPKIVETGRMELDDVDNLETWTALEKCVEKKLVKCIGLSNFNEQQIAHILQKCQVRPTVLQVECHPFLQQEALRKYCEQESIAMTAYSPLGGSTNDRPEDTPSPLKDPALLKIAEAHGKNPGQVCIKYCISRGIICIPKSVSPERIKTNSEVFDWELSAADMDTLKSIDCDWRGCVPSVQENGKMVARDAAHKDFPFKWIKKKKPVPSKKDAFVYANL